MFDAGLAIVILAIVLDRLTEQASERLDPRRRAPARRRPLPRRRRGAALVALRRRLVVVGLVLPCGPTTSPTPSTFSFRDPVNAVVDWLRSDVAWLTSGLKDVVSYGLLNPIQDGPHHGAVLAGRSAS